MLIRDVSKKLFEGMAPRMSQHGFGLNKGTKSFTRTSGSAKQIFQLLFYKYSEGIYVQPDMILKIKEIEDIYHIVTVKPPKYYDGTVTLGNNIGKLMDYYDKGVEIETGNKIQYLIENDEDVEILIKVISKRFEEYVLPYFEQNSTIARVDELLNKYPREISIHQWLYPMRACIAIIAAKLNNNPRYDELVAIYDEELVRAAEEYKIEYARLKILLKDN